MTMTTVSGSRLEISKLVEDSSTSIQELVNVHVEDLVTVPRESLIKLWGTLPAPSVPLEMDGEYQGYVHYGGDLDLRGEQVKTSFNLHVGTGFWLGKAFQTTGDDFGEGYNRFLSPKGEYKRFMRYKWKICPSAVDGKPALVMDYGAYNNVNGRVYNLKDEARVLNKHTFLCTVYADQAVPGVVPRVCADGKSEYEFFFLGGPVSPWRGMDDINAEIDHV